VFKIIKLFGYSSTYTLIVCIQWVCWLEVLADAELNIEDL